MFGRGKYRLRTWLRGNLPYVLSDRIPKGREDCGNHVWYRRDDEFEDCYHCDVGVRRVRATGETVERAPRPRPRVPVGRNVA